MRQMDEFKVTPMGDVMHAAPTETRSTSIGDRLTALRDWAASPVSSNAERVMYILLFALLVAVRIPRILLEGRFWAEEGRIFYERAWERPWLDALFLPYTGYLNLTANLAGVLARHFAPLPIAPYVTTGLALLIQCVPAILIVTSRLDWLQRRVVLLIALLIVATPPDSQEVWLNTSSSQFHLVLATAIILAVETRSGLVGALQLGVLCVAPLSCPASWVLVPLFGLRSAIDRSWPRAVQTLVLLAGVIAQLALFFTSVGPRAIGMPPSLFGAIVLTKNIIAPLLYHSQASILIGSFATRFSELGGPIWCLVIVVVLFAAAIMRAVLLTEKSPLWFLISGATIATASYAGAIGSKLILLAVIGDDRYAFAPQVLFALAVLSWSIVEQGPVRVWARGAVAWLLIVGLMEFPTKGWQTGPPWPAEVQKWQQNPSYSLQIWPTGWDMTLPPR
jgi:hypothetical protein